MNYVQKVREFTMACNDDLTSTPKLMSTEAIRFIRQMINDELDELEQAATTIGQADALIDLIYYTCDCAVKHGLNLDPMFAIVHDANMQKVVNGKVIRRDDGKILKPAGWQDPHAAIDEEIKRQHRDGSFA